MELDFLTYWLAGVAMWLIVEAVWVVVIYAINSRSAEIEAVKKIRNNLPLWSPPYCVARDEPGTMFDTPVFEPTEIVVGSGIVWPSSSATQQNKYTGSLQGSHRKQ